MLQTPQGALKDPYRLAYHIMAPTGWLNDPNGLIQWRDEYHVFYQHHPFRPEWGPMHWGHVKSKDLVHWEYLPIALAPDEQYDRDGCFSGSAVEEDGKLTLLYTGNVWVDPERAETKQVQCLATSSDGVTFYKDATNPVIAAAPGETSSNHFRDPKVWRHGNGWYVVIGTQIEGKGAILVYTSQDLRQWHYRGSAAENDGKLGYMWECPDFFSLGENDILLFSPQGMESQGENYQNQHQTGYLVGKMDYATGKMAHGAFEELDKGFDFYAAQTFLDNKGRRILIGWMDMWDASMPTQAYGWAGALTLPRELSLNAHGRMVMRPVAELQTLRAEHYHREAYILSGLQQGCSGDRFELIAAFSLENCTATTFGIKVRCSADGQEETVIAYDVAEGMVSVDRDRAGKGVNGIRRSSLPGLAQTEVTFQIFVDRSSLEVFVNDGEVVFSCRTYPDPASLGTAVFAEGGSASLLSYDVWQLEDIWWKD